MRGRSSAQLLAQAAGVGLVVLGLAGFFYNGEFTANHAVHDDMFGLFRVNGWHNTLHVASGAIGLVMASSPARSRDYALGTGVLYLGLAIWGFAIGSGHSILSIVPVNLADNLLHLAIGVAGLAAGISSSRATVPV